MSSRCRMRAAIPTGNFRSPGRYQFPRAALNGSYVHSRAYGDLNDPFLFIGNYPQAVVQPDQKGRLVVRRSQPCSFLVGRPGPVEADGPARLRRAHRVPVLVQNQYRDYVGPRSSKRFPRFQSADLQITRPFTTHIGDKELHLRAGGSVFNVFNHDNPRDVQNNLDSSTFGVFLQRRLERISRKAGIRVLTMRAHLIFASILLCAGHCFGCPGLHAYRR